MKVLVIGLGGIGSYLLRWISDSARAEQISPQIIFDIADDDMVELKNTKYQDYSLDDVGSYKTDIIYNKYCEYLPLSPIKQRITKEEQLKGYDLFVICADNFKVRQLIFEYCYKNNKEFIDLRSEGRFVVAFQKTGSLTDDLETLDLDDSVAGSCQNPRDSENGIIQKGNLIVSSIGIQMLLNFLRGDRNSKIFMRI